MIPLKSASKKTLFVLLGLVIIILAFLGIQYYWLIPGVSIQSFRMTGESMRPSLQEGDRILVSRLYYSNHEPRRGDLVLFRSPWNSKQWYLKRIVALGGETLEIKGSQIFINSKEVKEPWIIAVQSQAENLGLGDGKSYQVPEDTVFVLGDNLNNSNDSRNFGVIPKRDLKGKVMVKYWPAGSRKIGSL
jgi:signal peptidase I